MRYDYFADILVWERKHGLVKYSDDVVKAYKVKDNKIVKVVVDGDSR